MSSISSLSGSSTLASYASVKNTQKAQTSSVVDELFNKLDTKQQGFLDKSELQTALTATNTNAKGTASADEMFSAMDADGDGKITKTELGNTLQSLMDKMDNLAASMRVRGGGDKGGDKGVDEGFTKDQLTEMSQDTSETDSKRASFMAEIANNFEAADSDGNGKVNRDEAMAYAEANNLEGPGGPQGGGGPQGAGGPPPGGMPPPGGGGASETESATASTDAADTNGDGKVSAKEAVDYLMAQLATNSETTEADESSSSTTEKSQLSAELSRQILQLVKTYGLSAANDANSSSQSLSATA